MILAATSTDIAETLKVRPLDFEVYIYIYIHTYLHTYMGLRFFKSRLVMVPISPASSTPFWLVVTAPRWFWARLPTSIGWPEGQGRPGHCALRELLGSNLWVETTVLVQFHKGPTVGAMDLFMIQQPQLFKNCGYPCLAQDNFSGFQVTTNISR